MQLGSVPPPLFTVVHVLRTDRVQGSRSRVLRIRMLCGNARILRPSQCRVTGMYLTVCLFRPRIKRTLSGHAHLEVRKTGHVRRLKKKVAFGIDGTETRPKGSDTTSGTSI